MSEESWSVVCAERVQHVDVATHAACLALDPRRRSIVLDSRPPTALNHEVASGAVVQLFFAGAVVDWSEVLEWLAGEVAQGHLQIIGTGFTAEMLWSGDWRVQWSEAAGDAVDAIRKEVSELTRAQLP